MPEILRIKPKLESSNKVAIVGSSGILLKQSYADKIDKFDEVVRFNRAPTSGWEHIVGSKTTVRIVNGHVFANVPFKRWKEDDTFVQKLKNSTIFVADRGFRKENVHKHSHYSNSIHHIHIDVLVRDASKRFDGGIPPLPTVGCLGILLYVMSDIKPSVFGWSNGKMSHYYNQRDSKTSDCHKFEMEWNLIKKLNDQKLITLQG